MTTNILNLPVVTAVDGTEYVPVVQGSTTKRMATGLVMLGNASTSTQSANTVFSGPSSGSAAAPSFRALVSDDLPTVPITKGGTGATTALTARAALGVGTADSPQFAGVNVGNASDTSVTRYAAGQLAVEGWPVAQKAGPFGGTATIVTRKRSMTSWPVGIAWSSTEDRLIWFEAVMSAHGPGTTASQLGSRVEAYYSDDGGLTKRLLATVYSDSVQRAIGGCAIGNMASGRIGGIVTTTPNASATTPRDHFFVYSDDQGVTWTWTELTGLSLTHFPYGMLMALPTAYGGDDTNGFYVVGYSGSPNSNALILQTTDNGANWTERVLLARDAGTLGDVLEPSVVITSQGAIMFGRGATNLWAAKSADMVTWSAWTDTGVLLDDNPVHAVCDADDYVHVIICEREDFSDAAQLENVGRSFRIPAATLYADLTTLGTGAYENLEWRFGDRGIGYFQSKRVDDEWFHVVKIRESSSTSNAGSGDIAIITSTPRPVSAYVDTTPARQIIHNPDFSQWMNGTSFADLDAGDSGLETASRWHYFPSGATADIERVTLTQVQRLLFPHRPVYALRLDTLSGGNTHSDFVGIYQRHYNRDFYDLWRYLQARQGLDFVLMGLGTPIPTVRVSLTINYGSGGSSTSTVSGTFSNAYTANDGSYVQYVRISPGLRGDPTFGTNPYIEIKLDCDNSATAFDAKIVGLWGYVGRPPDEPADLDAIENAMQCALADDGTDTAGTVTFHRPLAAPSLTLGTDLPLTEGGTGASTARGALANLGGWHVLAASNVAVPVPNNALTTEQTYVTVAVPAGAMGNNGHVRVTCVWTYTNSGNTKTMRVAFGGTNYIASALTTSQALRAQCQIGNRNSASSQIGGPLVAGGFGTTASAGNVTSAVDTSASVNITITGQTASAGETLTLESYMVELYYAA